MVVDNKYLLEHFPLELKASEAIDFTGEPILIIETDIIGNKYLSYLLESNDTFEQRVIIQVSEQKLKDISANEVSINEAFANPENKCVFIIEFYLSNGSINTVHLLPSNVYAEINPISKDYKVDFEYGNSEIFFDKGELILYSRRKNKFVFDFYLHGKNLRNNIKPYALFKVFTPVVEILKSFLGIDGRNIDDYLAFSNIRQNSLGVTIEVNSQLDMYAQKEVSALKTLSILINAETKKEYENIISSVKSEKFFKHYSILINSIIENDATLNTALANPINNEIIVSSINKQKAQKAKKIIDETFNTIADTEEVLGKFLDINLANKIPRFIIQPQNENLPIKGVLELSIIEKIKEAKLNIGKKEYKFFIKTIFHPGTTTRIEFTERYLFDYEEL
jgi:hypothetical protein